MSKTIVSVTSFPPRVNHILPALESIVAQCGDDDLCVLWLGEKQFPNGLTDVPTGIVELFARHAENSEIRFTKDVRSFTKLVPALRAFPESPVITLDDDNFYPDGVVAKLKRAAQRMPGVILTHCASDLYRSHGKWRRTTGNVGFIARGGEWMRMLTGGGGVYYPPHSLDDLVFDTDLALKLCATSDDIWFWFCAVRKRTLIRMIRNGITRHRSIGAAASTGALSAINEVNDDEVNLRNLSNLFEYDPGVERLVLEDYNRHRLRVLCLRCVRLLVRYPAQAWYCLRRGGVRFLWSELRRKLFHFRNLIGTRSDMI